MIDSLPLDYLHLSLPGMSRLYIHFGIIALYFWSVFRPDLVPIWLVFLFGLLLDFMGGGIVGYITISFLLVRAIVGDQNHLFLVMPTLMLWAIGGVIILLFDGLGWLIYGVIAVRWVNIFVPLINSLFSVIMIPLIFWLLQQIRKNFIIDSERSMLL